MRKWIPCSIIFLNEIYRLFPFTNANGLLIKLREQIYNRLFRALARALIILFLRNSDFKDHAKFIMQDVSGVQDILDSQGTDKIENQN